MSPSPPPSTPPANGNRRRVLDKVQMSELQARTSGHCEQLMTMDRCKELAADDPLKLEHNPSTPSGCYKRLGKWVYNTVTTTKAKVFACSAARVCYCGQLLDYPPSPTPAPTPSKNSTEYEIIRPDLSIENTIDVMNTTPTPYLSWLDKWFAAPDLDDHREEQNIHHRAQVSRIVDRDSRL